MRGPRASSRTPRVALLFAVCVAVGLDATSTARRPPTPSTHSRASDTPVVDHVYGGGPDGGAIWSLAILATRPATVFAATWNGGVFKSSNGGLTWTAADRGLPPQGPCDLVAAPDSSALYAGCGDGLFKTTNAGTLWRQLDLDDGQPPFIAPSAPHVLYQPVIGVAVVRSVDGGRRWSSLGEATQLWCPDAFAIDRSDPFTLFCGDEQWLKVSRDGGASWRQLTGSHPSAEIRSLVIDPSNEQTMIAGTSDGRVFRSTNRGAAWYSVADGPADGAIESLRFADPSGTVLFAEQDGTIIRSLDGGDHWDALPSGWANSPLWAFAVDPIAPSTVYAGTQDGVMVSTDLGRHWELRRNGISRANAHVSFQEGSTSPLAATVEGEVFTSRDGGDTWSRSASTVKPAQASEALTLPNGRHPSSTAIAAGDPDVIYASTGAFPDPLGANEIWRTTDGGRNWQIVDHPPAPIAGRCCKLLADPNDIKTVYAVVGGVGIDASGDVVRRTTDGGLTWTEVPVPGLSFVFAVTPTVPTTLLIQAFDVTGTSRYAFLRSTDRGDHWARAGTGLPEDILLTSIAVDPRQPARLFAGTHGRGVYRSVDGGLTWQPTGRKP